MLINYSIYHVANIAGSKHKLIPSVYAGLVIKEQKLSYSGPTYIAIRSGKHDSSSARAHGTDLDRMFQIPELDYLTKADNLIKPIIIQLVDGGPDQNPAFPKTLEQAIRTFKTYNFDAVFCGYSRSSSVSK